MTLHFRFVRLRPDPERLARALALLSPDELDRGATFRERAEQDRFVLSRAHLRLLLGSLLQADPRSLQFGYGPAGKPVLVGRHAVLRFNLSHSGPGLLIGFSSGRDVGVDLEAIVPARVSLDVARRLFSPRLVGRLEATDGAARARLFFRAWTRLEARIKAGGGGLGAPIPAEHRVRSFSPASGFVAAAAIAGAPRGTLSSPSALRRDVTSHWFFRHSQIATRLSQPTTDRKSRSLDRTPEQAPEWDQRAQWGASCPRQGSVLPPIPVRGATSRTFFRPDLSGLGQCMEEGLCARHSRPAVRSTR